MDNRELDGSSSSPSDNLLRVDSIGGTVGGYRVVLEDGSSFFVSFRRWEDISIAEGDELSPQAVSELGALSYRSEFEVAQDKAVELLARREHTSFQLEQKLLKREFSRQVVSDLLPFLKEKNYLNERRYAEEWLRVRMRRNPFGPAKARATLLEHGVPESIVRDVLEQYETEHPDAWIEAAERAVRKMPDRGRITPEKCAQRLLRRGFSPSHFRSIDLDQLLG